MTVLEKDVIMGTFTHRTTYLKPLLDSVKKYLPDIPFVIQYSDGTVFENFKALREKFKESGKRYWLFFDDDIQFLSSDVVHNAVRDLIKYRWSGVTTYMTHNTNILNTPYPKHDLPAQELTMMIGYFQLFDSHVIRDLEMAEDLPNFNNYVDLTTSLSAKKLGCKLGISPGIVYHLNKHNKPIKQILKNCEAYLVNRYGAWGSSVRFPFDYTYRDDSYYYAAKEIPGIMDDEDLYWLLVNADNNSEIVEIGTWLGKTTKVLSVASGTVYTIDNLNSEEDWKATFWGGINGQSQKDLIEQNLKEEIASGRVVPMYMDSSEALKILKQKSAEPWIHLLFIDGAHDYERVKEEITSFMPLVMEGGLICGHDKDLPGVRQAIDELCPDWFHVNNTGKIWAWSKEEVKK